MVTMFLAYLQGIETSIAQAQPPHTPYVSSLPTRDWNAETEDITEPTMFGF